MSKTSQGAAPCLLLATPILLDPNFHESVVLLFHHTEEGALGLVINRPSEGSLRGLIEGSGIEIGDAEPAILEQNVMLGGPVNPTAGWVVFEGEDPTGQSFRVEGDLHVTGAKEVLETLLNRDNPGRLAFLAGYAGWGPGQLDAELETGAWMPAPLDCGTIFDASCDGKWRKSFLSIGIDPSMWSMEQGEG